MREPGVAVIKKEKHYPECEFGAIVSHAKNDDGLMILFNREYQHNVADVMTMGQVIGDIKKNLGCQPQEVTAL